MGYALNAAKNSMQSLLLYSEVLSSFPSSVWLIKWSVPEEQTQKDLVMQLLEYV